MATTFVNLYQKGLIYRSERIINWCPRCQTALSDLETSHEDTQGHLYHIKYPLVGQPGCVIVATTRPETMFGDVAVAVHPEEKKYADLIGKTVAIPVINRPIPVIADEAVDRSFGTGALKITPAHDPVDFEIAQRHNLTLVNILKKDASLNKEAGPYEGFDRFDCRKDLLVRLEKDGLLVKVEPHTHAVGHCMRCGTVVEPWASQQWFVKAKPLAEPAIEAVKSGQITIIPDQFQKVYLNWMENIRDWCISRQLWWGHRIPAWYCDDCGEITVTVDKPGKCAHCGSGKIQQDPDVLDTWFSSGLWPHSTLGWPDDTEDLRYFYPTTVMETAYDILFFWVARMIMMGLENTGRIPFRCVYLHGLIRDEKGAKMSKMKGNVINPLDSIDTYGADALRFSLVLGTSAGNDIPLSSGKMESGRNFANKLWNASRYVIRSLPEGTVDAALPPNLPVEDRWILSRLDQLAGRVNKLLEEFRFGEAEAEVYEFVWGEFCDWYIELAKIRLNQPGAPSPVPVLVRTLEASLRLLHPFMPFITEEIWQTLVSRLPHDATRPDSLIIASYPVSAGFTDPAGRAGDEPDHRNHPLHPQRPGRSQDRPGEANRGPCSRQEQLGHRAAPAGHRDAGQSAAAAHPRITKGVRQGWSPGSARRRGGHRPAHDRGRRCREAAPGAGEGVPASQDRRPASPPERPDLPVQGTAGHGRQGTRQAAGLPDEAAEDDREAGRTGPDEALET